MVALEDGLLAATDDALRGHDLAQLAPPPFTVQAFA
jgi:hypothetical protein